MISLKGCAFVFPRLELAFVEFCCPSNFMDMIFLLLNCLNPNYFFIKALKSHFDGLARRQLIYFHCEDRQRALILISKVFEANKFVVTSSRGSE